MKNGVIYLLKCVVSGKVYVGQTTQPLQKYLSSCVKEAMKGSKNKPHLYAAIRKYGEGDFFWFVLTEASSLRLNDLEIAWIRSLQATDRLIGYNIALGGGSVHGEFLTKEHRRKIAASCTGLTRSPETREKMRLAKLKEWQDQAYRDKVLKGIRQPHKINRISLDSGTS